VERAASLRNSELVATGRTTAGHRGEYFVDSDVYRWLEAVGWELGRLGPEDGEAEQLSELADGVICSS
jgi:DUF1680 family protein